MGNGNMIQEYNILDTEWDEIVQSFGDYDVYQLSGYVKAFDFRNEGTPMLILYEGKSNRGINVVMKRDISDDQKFAGHLEKGKLFDLTTPYGYGGWLFEGDSEENDESFINEFSEWCVANQIVSDFVRFNPIQNNNGGFNKRLYNPIYLGKTVAIELDDPNHIWERFSSKNRGHIRKAIKSGVEVRITNDELVYDDFIKIYETTMQRDEASDYYHFNKPFYESIRNDLSEHSLMFTAYLDGLPIAASIMLFANHYMNYHLSGQLFEYRKYSGTSLILYEAAKWGCEHGYKTLHLGGGVGAQTGPLYEYKKSFNAKGNDYEFYVGKRILMPEKYDELCKYIGIEYDGTNGYFPAYRK